MPVAEPTESTTESASSEAPHYAGLYSYAYQHMVARIMEFLNMQRRGRVVTTRAEVHHNRGRRQNPRPRRPSSDPISRVWSAGDSSASNRDSSASIRDTDARDSSASAWLFPTEDSNVESREISSRPDSDYLEGLGTDEPQIESVYERIDDTEIVTKVSNV